ncbi:MAG: hypothetical protein K2Y37_21265 [Pirellulales bacterium]|nr:hypothetical protein [Pirellulales bacterium]
MPTLVVGMPAIGPLNTENYPPPEKTWRASLRAENTNQPRISPKGFAVQ